MHGIASAARVYWEGEAAAEPNIQIADEIRVRRKPTLPLRRWRAALYPRGSDAEFGCVV
jgi:hypothetical protein